jgi:hypothetical protein
VTLTGEVNSQSKRAQVEQVASSVPNVRDWRADLRRLFNACPCTLDCRGCDRAIGRRGSDGCQSNAPKGPGGIAVVVPESFG